MSVPLSYKQTMAWQACHDPTVDEVFFGGGARLGKSVFLCAYEIIEATTYAGTRGLIGRAEYTTLRDSTLKTWWQVLGQFGYQAGKHYTWNGADQEVRWANGSLTMFRHLRPDPSDPDYTRLGSTEFTRASIDEANECDERLIEMLLMRTGYNVPPHGGKVICTGNPGDYWTKTRYVYDKKGQSVDLRPNQRVILATVKDNPDPVVRAEYTRRLENMTNEYDRRRLLHGDWLVQPRTGLEFFPDFSKSNVKPLAYDPTKPLHITFDFNVVPHMTLLVAQIHALPMGRWRVHFLKEYTPAHPLSTTQAVCKMLLEDLKTGAFAGHSTGVLYYGDRSGKNRSTAASDDRRHDFDVVEAELIRHVDSRSDRVLRRNPPHRKASEFMNHCFAGRLPIEITFDPSMHTTISDLTNLKTGPDGEILKEYTKDARTKSKYEKWGHCSQAAYYLAIAAFKDVFDEMEAMAG